MEQAGSDAYRDNHLSVMFRDGFSFSGYERDGVYLNVARDEVPASGTQRRYRNVSGVSGLDSVTDGRAAVFADFDNDGDLDIFLTTIQGQAHLLFRNNVGDDRNYLRVALQGSDSGTDAFGAEVRVKTSRGVQTKIKSAGRGYLAQNDSRLLFGLGDDDSVEWIEVTWPTGKKDRFDGPPAGGNGFAANSSWMLKEGGGAPASMSEKRSSLPNPLSKADRLLADLGLSIGDRLPEINVAGRDGKAGALSSHLVPGKTHLVNVWATWCVPCATEMPELQRRADDFKASGVELLGISIDTKGGPARINEFLDEKSIEYPIVHGGQAAIDAIYGEGDVFVPLTFVLDGSGRIEAAFGGWSRDAQLELERLLDG